MATKRYSEEIIIAIIVALRQSPNGLSLNMLKEGQANVHHYNASLFYDYMAGKGLASKLDGGRIILTDLGRSTPLKPEEFYDFGLKGGKRSKFQMMRDIRRVLRGHGQATPYDICLRIMLSTNATHTYLNELEAKGEVQISDGKYKLTELGLAKVEYYNETPIERVQRPVSSGTSESLTRILENAHGGNIETLTGICPTFRSPRRRYEYIKILFQYGLLTERDWVFHTTELYEEIDKEALPYALDRLVDSEISRIRSGTSIKLNILAKLLDGEPQTAQGLKERWDHSTYKKHLTELEEVSYVASVRHGNYTYYQITSKGRDFVNRVNNCVGQLSLKAT